MFSAGVKILSPFINDVIDLGEVSRDDVGRLQMAIRQPPSRCIPLEQTRNPSFDE